MPESVLDQLKRVSETLQGDQHKLEAIENRLFRMETAVGIVKGGLEVASEEDDCGDSDLTDHYLIVQQGRGGSSRAGCLRYYKGTDISSKQVSWTTEKNEAYKFSTLFAADSVHDDMKTKPNGYWCAPKIVGIVAD